MTKRTSNDPRRILLIMEDGLLRAGLRLLLQGFGRLRVEVALPTARGSLPAADVLLVDLDGPGFSETGELTRLKRAFPDRPILVLSARSEEIFGLRSLQAGASGFISTASAPEELRRALERVAAGSRYISPSLAERLASPGREDSLQGLSLREFQILLGIASGLRGKELGGVLGISPKTVCTYRARILSKLGVKSDAELVLRAAAAGVGPPVSLVV